MRPPTKLQVFANFDPKNVTTLYHPSYPPDVSSPDYLLFPKLNMKLKGLHFVDVADIQAAVTDEIKNFQKEEFSACFQKRYDRAKPVYMPMELISNKKKLCVFFVCLRFLKNQP
jgi:hypothetical protein